MKKVLLGIVLIFAIVAQMRAQVPYYGATVGKEHFFVYHSLKIRPGINNQRTYTTLQFGVNDWFSVGTDLTTGPGEKFVGYYLRVGKKFNQWFSVGLQSAPTFDLDDSHKFGYLNTGFFMNGDITKDGKLFWTINTWHTIDKDGENTFDQYWYLAGKLPTGKNSSFWPHIGLTHSWKFNEDSDLAAGFFYVYKQYSFYIWGNDFFKEHPRLTLAVDFTF